LKTKIIIKNKTHLFNLIDQEIALNGKRCDLNHLDVLNITDMSNLFKDSHFNGDISQWNVSNVINMSSMFEYSKFNADISDWDVSNVTNMFGMFHGSIFNLDISNWDVSKVENMDYTFNESKFRKDLSKWRPYNLKSSHNTFLSSTTPIPYWDALGLDEEDRMERRKVIDTYHLNKELKRELGKSGTVNKRVKI
jgi:surface protein